MARRQHSREQTGSVLKRRRIRANDCLARGLLRDCTRSIAALFRKAARWQPGLSVQVMPLERVFNLSSVVAARAESRDGDHADQDVGRSDSETVGRQSARLVLGDEKRSQEGTPGTTGIVSTSEGAIGRAASRGTGPQGIPRRCAGNGVEAGRRAGSLSVTGAAYESHVRRPMGRGKRAL